jgi:GNL3L/Grn1 putative GTPase
MGIPNLYPYKEDLMNALERREKNDTEMKEHYKQMNQAEIKNAKGSLENYVQVVKGKVEKFEEEKKTMYGGLTEEEFNEA